MHVRLVPVRQTVAIRVEVVVGRVGGIGPVVQDLDVVRDATAVGVGQGRVGAVHVELAPVVQTVAVGVEHVVAGRRRVGEVDQHLRAIVDPTAVRVGQGRVAAVHVQLVPVAQIVAVGVEHVVPRGRRVGQVGQHFDPVVDPAAVRVGQGRVGAVHVRFVPVGEAVAIGVQHVVARCRRVCQIGQHLHSVVDAPAVGVGVRRVGAVHVRFVPVGETVAIGVEHVVAGRRRVGEIGEHLDPVVDPAAVGVGESRVGAVKGQLCPVGQAVAVGVEHVV